MKKFLLLGLLLCLFMPTFSGPKSKAQKDTEQFHYDIECAGNGAPGTYLVKVWSYSRNAKVAAEQGKKNAVHGVIFKGFSTNSYGKGQAALAKNPGVEIENAAYFEEFFKEGGEYQKYVSAVSGTQEVMKVGKEYRVGIVFSVAKDDLRKALEAAGVIKGLNYGF